MPDHSLTLTQKIMFLAVLSAIFLAAMDQTVVSTALPTIARDLHGLAYLPWIVTAYLWTSTVALPVYGKLGDMLGRKRMLWLAVAIFLLGSLLSGLSWSLPALIAFRAFQGVGGGGILVIAIASIADFIPLEQRGRYQGLVGAAFGLATLVGPFLGGFLVENLGWRWIFYVNVPFGLATLVIIGRAFPTVAPRPGSFDWIGALALFLGLSAIIMGLELHANPPWSELLVAVMLLSFLLWWRQSGKVANPIIPLHFFRYRTFWVSTLVSFFVGMAMLGTLSFLPTYYQEVRGLSPTQSGLQLLFLLAGMMVTSILSGRWISKYQRFRAFPIIGTFLTAVSLGMLTLLTAHTPFWQIHAALILLGIGLGSTMQVMILSAQWTLPHQHLGVATSTVSLFRSMGGTIAVAGFGTVFTRFVAQAQQHGQDIPATIVHALHWDFAIAAGLIFLAFVASWWLEELDVLRKRRAQHHSQSF